MISFFSYLREKAKEAVLAGVQDALDQIDPILANHTPSLPAAPHLAPHTGTTPQLPAVEAKSTAPPESSSTPVSTAQIPSASGVPSQGGGLQERLAQATSSIGANNPPLTPPKPSSPKRGRGKPGDGTES